MGADVNHVLDQMAHLLHRIHLIPGRLLGRVCDRYDRWLGVTKAELDAELDAMADLRPVGYRCEHMHMTTGAVVTLPGGPAPSIRGACWHGCTMTPIY